MSRSLLACIRLRNVNTCVCLPGTECHLNLPSDLTSKTGEVKYLTSAHYNLTTNQATAVRLATTDNIGPIEHRHIVRAEK